MNGCYCCLMDLSGCLRYTETTRDALVTDHKPISSTSWLSVTYSSQSIFTAALRTCLTENRTTSLPCASWLTKLLRSRYYSNKRRETPDSSYRSLGDRIRMHITISINSQSLRIHMESWLLTRMTRNDRRFKLMMTVWFAWIHSDSR